MSLRWIWIPLALTLQACAEPKFEFRGYSDLSSCQRVVDAELENGATLESGYESDEIDNFGYVTELSGTIFSERVRIDVLCTPAGEVGSIHYVSLASDPRDTGRVWALFSDELGKLFGEPAEVFSEIGRSRRYLCRNPSPILIDEWRLEAEEGAPEDEEPDHEVYIAVIPGAAECLDDRDG